MKKIILLLLTCLGTSYCQTDLNGIWSDSNSTSFKNCYLIIAQKSSSIFVTHYIEYNGQPLVEKGVGQVKKNEIQYQVEVTKGISGWATKGKHYLRVENNAEILRGYYIDEKGNKGPLVFKKIKF